MVLRKIALICWLSFDVYACPRIDRGAFYLKSGAEMPFSRQSERKLPRISSWPVYVRGGANEQDQIDGNEGHDAEESALSDHADDEYDFEEYDHSESVDDLADDTEGTKADEPYFMSPSVQLFATIACMFLGRRFDLFRPVTVRFIRFSFVAQVVLQQIFILYVMIAARRIGDTTVVQVKNQLSDAILSQVNQAEGAPIAIVKQLTSSFLSSETTVMDYDLKQASNMQGGVIFNLCLMWVVHFKLEKVQPLLIHIITSLIQLAYSPLFQVYVLGRNLERPFKTPSNNFSRGLQVAEDVSEDGGIAAASEPGVDTDE